MCENSTALPTVGELAILWNRLVFADVSQASGRNLHKVVGLEVACGFVRVVGQEIGDEINRTYKSALAVDNLGQARLVTLPPLRFGPQAGPSGSSPEVAVKNRLRPDGLPP